MTWSPAVYLQSANEASLRTILRNRLGLDIPANERIPTGNHTYSIVSEIDEWTTRPTIDNPGERLSGFWVMIRFNLDTAIGASAYTTFLGLPERVNRTQPSNVFL